MFTYDRFIFNIELLWTSFCNRNFSQLSLHQVEYIHFYYCFSEWEFLGRNPTLSREIQNTSAPEISYQQVNFFSKIAWNKCFSTDVGSESLNEFFNWHAFGWEPLLSSIIVQRWEPQFSKMNWTTIKICFQRSWMSGTRSTDTRTVIFPELNPCWSSEISNSSNRFVWNFGTFSIFRERIKMSYFIWDGRSLYSYRGLLKIPYLLA